MTDLRGCMAFSQKIAAVGKGMDSLLRTIKQTPAAATSKKYKEETP